MNSAKQVVFSLMINTVRREISNLRSVYMFHWAQQKRSWPAVPSLSALNICPRAVCFAAPLWKNNRLPSLTCWDSYSNSRLKCSSGRIWLGAKISSHIFMWYVFFFSNVKGRFIWYLFYSPFILMLNDTSTFCFQWFSHREISEMMCWFSSTLFVLCGISSWPQTGLIISLSSSYRSWCCL